MAQGVEHRHPHRRALLSGIFAAVATFVLFYLMTVFALGWGTTRLGYPREQFLWLQLLGVVLFGLTIPLAAVQADRHGRRRAMLVATLAIGVFGFALAPLFVAGNTLAAGAFLALGFALMGLTYGPVGTLLADVFPTAVRYTGASLAFNIAGIVGASVAPYLATWLGDRHGLPAVGAYLTLAASLSFLALLLMPAPQAEPAPQAA